MDATKVIFLFLKPALRVGERWRDAETPGARGVSYRLQRCLWGYRCSGISVDTWLGDAAHTPWAVCSFFWIPCSVTSPAWVWESKLRPRAWSHLQTAVGTTAALNTFGMNEDNNCLSNQNKTNKPRPGDIQLQIHEFLHVILKALIN